jgi:hypothetical protein
MGEAKSKQDSTVKQQNVLPGRETATQFQVGTLMSMMGMAMSALGHLDTSEKCAEARIACESLFISVCERLQQIAEDPDRWDKEFQRKLEAEFQRLIDVQRTAAEASVAVHKAALSPHYLYRPTLARLADGNFIAYLGDDSDLVNALALGIGDSPMSALEAFDTAFAGKEISPFMEKWLAERQEQIAAGNPPTPFPKIGDNNELDTRDDRETESPEDSEDE